MEPTPTDDAVLLRAHIAGDPRAFGCLYDRHDRQCFQFIRRMLGSGGDASEDLHQETWIAISNNAAAFNPDKASFRTWMFTIARHKVWDYFRRQRVVVPASSNEDAAIMVPDPGPTPVQHVESRELAQSVVVAIDALPLAQRETFVMFAYGDLSLEEIARATDTGIETAKSRLRYARATLRQALAAERAAHV